MANTSPIKAVQNGLRKHNLTQSASAIREAATALELDISQDASVEPLINYFVEQGQGSAIAQTQSEVVDYEPQEHKILENSSGLSVPMAQSEPINNTLTVAQKQTLTQIQAQQLGIELSQLEITEVSSMVATDIVDSVSYLQAVGEIIKQFIERRNNQASALISEQITNIATIINTGNDQLGDIFNGANRQLNEIVSQCKQRREDYKSPYASKLEGIREILQIL